MSKDGKFVWCNSGADGEPVDHEVSRVLCLLSSRPGCPVCPNSQFDMLFQIRVTDQMVACPRWGSEDDFKNKRDPLDYVAVQRDTCIRESPFPFCEDCPNSRAAAMPETQPKWFELKERMRRIELELDEEELDER